MDHEPRAVHTAQCHEYSSLRQAPRSERMRQATIVLLPWWIFVVESPHHSGSNIGQLDHRVEHARP
jgi:hypothetical protein